MATLSIAYGERKFRIATKKPLTVAKCKRTLAKAQLRDVAVADLVLKDGAGAALDDAAVLEGDVALYASSSRAAASSSPRALPAPPP